MGAGVGVLCVALGAFLSRSRSGPGSARLLEALPEAIALFDADGRLTRFNRRLLELLPAEVPSSELVDSGRADLYARLSPDDAAIERARDRARRAMEDPEAILAFEVPSYGRGSLHVKERITEDGGTVITIHRLSPGEGPLPNDSLTGLPNRSHLVSVLAERCARTSNRLALMIVDLRSFRQINDTYGREVGDELLRQTAICLRHAMPDSALIARTAGDEFAVLLEFSGVHGDIERRIQELLATLRGGLNVLRMNVPVRASVGIAYAPAHGNTVSTLLTAADSACAHAKRLGNNRLVVYNSTRQQEAKRRHQLEVGLQLAIEKDELSLQYQPQVDIRSTLTCGMEALLRWNSREFGRVSPVDFVPIAEQTGIIGRVGDWVLERAVRDYQRSSRFGMPSSAMLSVNLSRKQFDDGRIVRDIAQLIERTGFDPARLCLELTETALFEDSAYLRKVLGQLSGLGMRLSIDDFGVGYSSLLELRDLPISEVKIDRAFIQDIANDAASQDIVGAIVDIAKSIGAQTVAEGIEDRQQFETVALLGCDRAQGYWLGRPMDATTPDVVPGGDAVT